MADEVRVNGNAMGWASVEFKVGGERFYGVKSISYSDSRTRSKVWGMGRHQAPRGQTSGKYDVDPVQVTIEKESAKALRAALAAKSADSKSFGSVEFEIVVQYTEGARNVTDELHRCTWSKSTSKSEEGPDALYEDVEFNCLQIEWDGKTLFDGSEGAP